MNISISQENPNVILKLSHLVIRPLRLIGTSSSLTNPLTTLISPSLRIKQRSGREQMVQSERLPLKVGLGKVPLTERRFSKINGSVR